jgi:hypothetical protein
MSAMAESRASMGAQLDIIRDMPAQDANPTAVADTAGVSRQVSIGSRTIPRRRRRCWPNENVDDTSLARNRPGRDPVSGAILE